MSERIDIEAYTQIFETDDGITEEQLVAFGLSAIAELKRCYEEIDEVRWMLMQAYDGQKEREREIDHLRSYCLDNGVCPYCGEAQQDPALRENLGVLKMCYSCEDKIHFGIEPNDNASE
tara:strand:- start:206 stop:562 length:357 start_codon:yes stop_codon:yes gene_type:complete